MSGSTMQADFVPYGDGDPLHFDVLYEKEQYPEDLEEKDNELNAAPATRRHMLDFLAAIDKGTKPVADVTGWAYFHRQLHPGQFIHGRWQASGI